MDVAPLVILLMLTQLFGEMKYKQSRFGLCCYTGYRQMNIFNRKKITYRRTGKNPFYSLINYWQKTKLFLVFFMKASLRDIFDLPNNQLLSLSQLYHELGTAITQLVICLFHLKKK